MEKKERKKSEVVYVLSDSSSDDLHLTATASS